MTLPFLTIIHRHIRDHLLALFEDERQVQVEQSIKRHTYM